MRFLGKRVAPRKRSSRRLLCRCAAYLGSGGGGNSLSRTSKKPPRPPVLLSSTLIHVSVRLATEFVFPLALLLTQLRINPKTTSNIPPVILFINGNACLQIRQDGGKLENASLSAQEAAATIRRAANCN